MRREYRSMWLPVGPEERAGLVEAESTDGWALSFVHDYNGRTRGAFTRLITT